MRLKSIIFTAFAFCFISCAKTDIPSISVVGQEEYVIDSNGGEITIPVISTGLDDVSIMKNGTLIQAMETVLLKPHGSQFPG